MADNRDSVPFIALRHAHNPASRRLSDEQVRQLHYDGSHLNLDGARHFTAAITPALLELEGGVGHAF